MKRYEAYKHSGVDWIGEIPEGWETNKLKSILSLHGRIGFRGYTVADLVDKGDGAITISPSNMFDGNLDLENSSYLSWEKYYESPEIMVEEGDFLLVKTASIGKLAYVRTLNEKATVNPQILVLKNVAINKSFFFYQLLSSIIQQQLHTEKIGSTIFTISEQKIKNFIALIPPLSEQTAIAEFLDDKTAKIDQLIGIKQKEIELLKERRQILIQQAVTGKLSMVNGQWLKTQTEKLKPSGVDWIGEIPEHWEVRKLKYCLTIKNGQDYKHVETESGYPVIGSGGQFAYASKYLYDGEAILLGRKGTIDKPQHIIGKFWTVDTMFYSIPKKKFLGKFLFYCCQCIPFSFYSTATALPSMTQKDLNNHPISIPNIAEQIEIVSHLEEIEEKIANAILLKQQEIEKLKEYKTVLIDNVVTGKVRVNKIN